MTGNRIIRRVLLFSLLAAALTVPTGCSRNPVTGRWEPVLISTQQEIVIGEEAAPEFEKEFGGAVADATLQNYVQTIGGKLAARSDRDMPYEYKLVASDVPNAFALPGGKVFITAGLMARMTNERQLAAVLGHETGHVAARHSVQQMQQAMGFQFLIELARTIAGPEKAEAAEGVSKVVATMVSLKYSRDDEYQADEVGVKYMARAGYNPWGMVELLTVLKNLSESEGGSLEEMFQTHPLTTKRIDRVRDIIRDDDEYKQYSQSAADPNAARFMEMRQLLIRTMGW
jgi:predicted Zn-dependent protease